MGEHEMVKIAFSLPRWIGQSRRGTIDRLSQPLAMKVDYAWRPRSYQTYQDTYLDILMESFRC